MQFEGTGDVTMVYCTGDHATGSGLMFGGASNVKLLGCCAFSMAKGGYML